MKILIVAATRIEVEPLEQCLLQWDEQGLLKQHAIELMITGAGSVFTAFKLGKMLPLDNWDLAINLGICGSFNRNFPIGTVVNITTDTFGDFGATDDHTYLNAFEIGLADGNAFPFSNGLISNTIDPKYKVIQSLPTARGITMNTVSGNENSIRRLIEKFPADVESMEGASFLYCCLKESIPCVQLRAVSNYVQKRDKSSWNIPLAIKNLNHTATSLIMEMIDIDNSQFLILNS
ncbi:MAG: futalosine hydrolase [Chitinophagaceae bacterium]|nr:futalosine hydrolase [Chitinophagaceae bacterium]